MEPCSNTPMPDMVLVRTKDDPSHEGKFRRVVIGVPGGTISGAIYLDPNQPMPRAIILEIPKEEEKK